MTAHASERTVATFTPDAAAFRRAHVVMAAAGGLVAAGVLIAIGDPNPWVGPVAATLALGLRGWYLRSEALATVWTMTGTRLVGPSGQIVPLAQVASVGTVFGSVQITTRSGDRHLIRYLADPAAAATRIEEAAR